MDDPGLVGRVVTGVDYRTRGEGGDYDPAWSWVALRGGRVVARAAWWGGPDDDEPVNLNWFDVGEDDIEAGVALLRQAPYDVEYELILPADWQERPDARAAAQARMEAARQAGMRRLVARFRYRWTPADGLPARPGRLVFRPEPDDAVVLDVLRRVHAVTLDAHALQAVEEGGLNRAAQAELDFFHWCPSPREWLRLAYTPGGEPVGIAFPAYNHTGPVVGFIGVVPEQRGRGYAYDLLAESTHFLVEQGAEYVLADTDETNVPMAANFTKAGYPVVQKRVHFV
ncbi:GNAT family N-acetyltransferase [Streptomyces sp. SID14478]|uniref:GNAT family N-acetyltransferase n=1 Tax=Streptomyces sp. SID14478 TaxID=2706073 RepID=UPI0013DCFB90|nr:GNAT family N-acetyltransferase [Streptomyces sp. SID14478]NEB77530.1 GNAT family N-acetyltransferase [Streptomyces sp. SID14478]